jgi:hypothetical protein
VRKYTLNENYFDSIDTEDKAYFLGLLNADGCNAGLTVRIALQEQDVDILNKFKYYINSDSPLRVRESHKLIKNNKEYTCKQQYLLLLNSRYLCNRLSNLGCVPAKSLILKFPKEHLSDDLVKHFIRGYFDGDGSVYTFKNKDPKRKIGYAIRFAASFSCNIYFAEELVKYIQKELDITFTSYQNKNEHPDSVKISIFSHKTVVRFLDWLYQDATVYLNRKFNKYHEIKNTVLMKPGRKKKNKTGE